ncbi:MULTISPECIES: choline ABC transporter substrate-binding protein [Pseudomonas]|jgi:glycine betaine/proline transport system substrate-binding protein|uniref:Choline ABC transporter substrate-binding protein n=1 Tax=Pseudomonas bijieensis TaxID=2681983 RepID=A0A6N1CFT0_9PSED|nr:MULTISPECIES: choline ABC transporter substrate-binding protein [Pseudomonas]AXP05732.1 choline ABC transporter substrate-binding protein [Pseudomonas fluorescens]MCD9113914.1 choline ABC transporter substrate-binding protein [Pseudomonas bijieensis]PWJ33044.1 glycine betaine/proline transport system substrate-binding protein [Pseudomonas sp. 43mfcvi1.1]QIB06307.1 choline ABC transporter substrate-binding protein [Pseudomonas fluorescens]QKS84209.1 choline ABC transporter substrate-binding 
MKGSTSLLLAAMLSLPMLANAAEPEQCKTVNFSDVGWTDITVTTATTSVVLDALGYKTKTTMISVPVTYKSLADGKNMDVFLGNWMPTMENDIKAYREAGTVDTVRTNLKGAKYTLAVPQALYDKGLHDFADIPKFKKELDGKIYGIEPGNDGNRLIQSMIEKNAFGLKDAGFKVVESSEAGMLSQVDRAAKRGTDVVFLGWAPHPMNTRFKIQYLTGGDDFFGPDFGAATVATNTRKGYSQECSNVGQLLKNLEFTVDMESTLMGNVLDDKMKPEAAAKAWLKKNPQVLDTWLAGVTTIDGKPGLEAVKAKLAQ